MNERLQEISWDELFMSLVFLISMKSKDKNTHVGAVIVDKKNRIVSLGYNGLPRGCDDCKKERQEAPNKYFWFEHAETNAILNTNDDLNGCTMYTNGIPCVDCARKLVQKGIKKVVVHKKWDKDNSPKWKESTDISKEMFAETGIIIRYFKGKPLDIIPWRDGARYEL